jgi:4-hydroxy-2-oxoheptanedioate aldolase
MNNLEKQMLDLLRMLKEKYCLTGVKAEFETEGIRREELLRLMDISLRAGLGISLKIGGCEAISDMQDAMRYGVERIIAPMIETPYALKKYINACQTVFPEDVTDNMGFLMNIETITAYQNLDAMLALPEASRLTGITIGRVDLVGSMQGQPERSAVNSNEVLTICLQIARTAKSKGLEVLVGGAVSIDSLPFLQQFPAGHLDRFETRKAIFGCPHALHNPPEAFLKAIEFEVLWLKNKQQYYRALSQEDENRIAMLESRLAQGRATLDAKQQSVIIQR